MYSYRVKIEQLMVTRWYTADTRRCTVGSLINEHAMTLRPEPPCTSFTSVSHSVKTSFSILNMHEYKENFGQGLQNQEIDLILIPVDPVAQKITNGLVNFVRWSRFCCGNKV